MWAVFCGKVKSINFLLEQDANLNLRDKDGWTALHIVIYSTKIDNNLKLEITRILVENGIGIHIKSNSGYTALDKARGYKLEEIIALLSNEEKIKELSKLKSEEKLKRLEEQEHKRLEEVKKLEEEERKKLDEEHKRLLETEYEKFKKEKILSENTFNHEINILKEELLKKDKLIENNTQEIQALKEKIQ